MLNKVGEISDPRGTPAGHDAVRIVHLGDLPVVFFPPENSLSITRKSLLHSYQQACPEGSYGRQSNAFRKSTNRVWTPCLPVEELSIESNQFSDMEVRADTVE